MNQPPPAIKCRKCGATFAPDMASKGKWPCPACRTPNPNLKRHYRSVADLLILNLAFTLLVIGIAFARGGMSILLLLLIASAALLVVTIVRVYKSKAPWADRPAKGLIWVVFGLGFFFNVLMPLYRLEKLQTPLIIVYAIVFPYLFWLNSLADQCTASEPPASGPLAGPEPWPPAGGDSPNAPQMSSGAGAEPAQAAAPAPPPAQPPGRAQGAWILALAMLCLGACGFALFFSRTTRFDAVFLAEKYLAYAFAIWSVYHVMCVRRRGAAVNVIAFAAIFGALFCGGSIAASRQKQEAVNVISSLQQELGRAADAVAHPTAIPNETAGTRKLPPREIGDYAEVERFLKEHVDRILAQKKEYLLELQGIGWNSILSPHHLKEDAELAESKATVEKAKAMVDKYRKKTDALMADSRSRISALAMTDAGKKSMLKGFDDNRSKAAASMNEQWKLEKDIVLEVEKIVADLAASQEWTVEGDTILFNDTAELERYNAGIGRIKQMAARQAELGKQVLASANDTLEAAKREAAK